MSFVKLGRHKDNVSAGPVCEEGVAEVSAGPVAREGVSEKSEVPVGVDGMFGNANVMQQMLDRIDTIERKMSEIFKRFSELQSMVGSMKIQKVVEEDVPVVDTQIQHLGTSLEEEFNKLGKSHARMDDDISIMFENLRVDVLAKVWAVMEEEERSTSERIRLVEASVNSFRTEISEKLKRLTENMNERTLMVEEERSMFERIRAMEDNVNSFRTELSEKIEKIVNKNERADDNGDRVVKRRKVDTGDEAGNLLVVAASAVSGHPRHDVDDTHVLNYIFSELDGREVLCTRGINVIDRATMIESLKPNKQVYAEVIDFNCAMLMFDQRKSNPEKGPRVWFLPTLITAEIVLPEENVVGGIRTRGAIKAAAVNDAAFIDKADHKFLYNALLGDEAYGWEIRNCERIFMPFHRKDHYFLIRIDLKDALVTIMDSLGHAQLEKRIKEARCAVDRLNNILKCGPSANQLPDLTNGRYVMAKNLPQQDGNNDCGVFVIKYMQMCDRLKGCMLNVENERNAIAVAMVRHEVNSCRDEVINKAYSSKVKHTK